MTYKFNILLGLITAFACTAAAQAQSVNISLVTVGDPGNVADVTGYGAVPYTYQIGEYDVTLGQYTAMLSAVASTDPYGLYNTSMGTSFSTQGITRSGSAGSYTYAVYGNANMPVFDVSWGDAARFVNWIQNGERSGSENSSTTENGTYALNGGTSNAALLAVTRSTSASWFLPSVNEFYKAAYYVGGGTNAGYWQEAQKRVRTVIAFCSFGSALPTQKLPLVSVSLAA